jgi:hypothetical protein
MFAVAVDVVIGVTIVVAVDVATGVTVVKGSGVASEGYGRIYGQAWR